MVADSHPAVSWIPPHGLKAYVTFPDEAAGVVVYAEVCCSDWRDPWASGFDRALTNCGFATIKVDLIGRAEAERPEHVIDICQLTDRCVAVLEWALDQAESRGLPLGMVGVHAAAGAALAAAAEIPGVSAIVSCDGRPDLAGGALLKLAVPTLLIVGERDYETIDRNQAVLEWLGDGSAMELIGGATQLVQDINSLKEVAGLSCQWLRKHAVDVTRIPDVHRI